MAKSAPAWQRLVQEGFLQTRQEAERWILAGKVRAGNKPVTSAGQPVRLDVPLTVKGIELPYVAKGGLKLEAALHDFGISVEGRVCIDAGASTGGFVDCLVKHGASRVYAVDVGYGQLAGSLRANPAVVNLEKTNIGDDALRALSPLPTLGTVDLSYLSLEKAVPLFAEILKGQGDLVCLVKPLFEVEDPVARRTGEIDADAYAPLLLRLAAHFASAGYAVCGMTHSPVTGNNGTVEFFLHLNLAGEKGMPPEMIAQAASEAVAAALALPIYQKHV